MAVALILITHDHAGQQLLNTAQNTLAEKLPSVQTVSVSPDCDPGQLITEGKHLCENINQGDGVLILTDLYGSTPGNVSRKLCSREVHVVFGLNLAMLIKVLNYRYLPLAELEKKAVEGGVSGIRLCVES